MVYTVFMLKNNVGNNTSAIYDMVLLCQYRDIAALDKEFYLRLFNKILNVMKIDYESTLQDILTMREKENDEFHECYTYNVNLSEYTFNDFDALINVLCFLEDNLDPDILVTYYMSYNDGSSYVNRKYAATATYKVDNISINLGIGEKILSVKDLHQRVDPEDQEDEDKDMDNCDCDSVS